MVFARDTNDNPIAVKYLAHLLAVEIDILVAIISNDKPEPIGMSTDAASDQCLRINRNQSASAVLDQLTIAFMAPTRLRNASRSSSERRSR